MLRWRIVSRAGSVVRRFGFLPPGGDGKKFDIWAIKAQADAVFEHLKESFFQVLADRRRIKELTQEKGEDDRKYTLSEYIEKHNLKKEVRKAYPYGLLVVLPFAPVILGLYLYLLPNAIPKQFLPVSEIAARNQRWYERQERAKAELRRIAREKGLLDEKHSQNYLFEEYVLLRRGMDLYSMDANTLELLCELYIKDYKSGRRFVGILYKLLFFPVYSYNFIMRKLGKINSDIEIKTKLDRYIPKINWGPLGMLRAVFLREQLYNHFAKIRHQDEILARDPAQIDHLNLDVLEEFGRERGLSLDGDRLKEYIKKHWAEITGNKRITDDRLLWVNIFHGMPEPEGHTTPEKQLQNKH